MKPGALWPVALAGVLGITVVANVALLIQAGGDAAAVEPDYYRKALEWDSTMAQAERNARLGWRVTGGLLEPDGSIEVRLADAGATPLNGAAVNLEGFAVGQGGGVLRTQMSELGAGRYGARLGALRPGLHELRLTVRRGPDRFTTVLRGDPGAPLSVIR